MKTTPTAMTVFIVSLVCLVFAVIMSHAEIIMNLKPFLPDTPARDFMPPPHTITSADPVTMTVLQPTANYDVEFRWTSPDIPPIGVQGIFSAYDASFVNLDMDLPARTGYYGTLKIDCSSQAVTLVQPDGTVITLLTISSPLSVSLTDYDTIFWNNSPYSKEGSIFTKIIPTATKGGFTDLSSGFHFKYTPQTTFPEGSYISIVCPAYNIHKIQGEPTVFERLPALSQDKHWPAQLFNDTSISLRSGFFPQVSPASTVGYTSSWSVGMKTADDTFAHSHRFLFRTTDAPSAMQYRAYSNATSRVDVLNGNFPSTYTFHLSSSQFSFSTIQCFNAFTLTTDLTNDVLNDIIVPPSETPVFGMTPLGLTFHNDEVILQCLNAEVTNPARLNRHAITTNLQQASLNITLNFTSPAQIPKYLQLTIRETTHQHTIQPTGSFSRFSFPPVHSMLPRLTASPLFHENSPFPSAHNENNLNFGRFTNLFKLGYRFHYSSEYAPANLFFSFNHMHYSSISSVPPVTTTPNRYLNSPSERPSIDSFGLPVLLPRFYDPDKKTSENVVYDAVNRYCKVSPTYLEVVPAEALPFRLVGVTNSFTELPGPEGYYESFVGLEFTGTTPEERLNNLNAFVTKYNTKYSTTFTVDTFEIQFSCNVYVEPTFSVERCAQIKAYQVQNGTILSPQMNFDMNVFEYHGYALTNSVTGIDGETFTSDEHVMDYSAMPIHLRWANITQHISLPRPVNVCALLEQYAVAAESADGDETTALSSFTSTMDLDTLSIFRIFLEYNRKITADLYSAQHKRYTHSFPHHYPSKIPIDEAQWATSRNEVVRGPGEMNITRTLYAGMCPYHSALLNPSFTLFALHDTAANVTFNTPPTVTLYDIDPFDETSPLTASITAIKMPHILSFAIYAGQWIPDGSYITDLDPIFLPYGAGGYRFDMALPDKFRKWIRFIQTSRLTNTHKTSLPLSSLGVFYQQKYPEGTYPLWIDLISDFFGSTADEQIAASEVYIEELSNALRNSKLLSHSLAPIFRFDFDIRVPLDFDITSTVYTYPTRTNFLGRMAPMTSPRGTYISTVDPESSFTLNTRTVGPPSLGFPLPLLLSLTATAHWIETPTPQSIIPNNYIQSFKPLLAYYSHLFYKHILPESRQWVDHYMNGFAIERYVTPQPRLTPYESEFDLAAEWTTFPFMLKLDDLLAQRFYLPPISTESDVVNAINQTMFRAVGITPNSTIRLTFDNSIDFDDQTPMAPYYTFEDWRMELDTAAIAADVNLAAGAAPQMIGLLTYISTHQDEFFKFNITENILEITNIHPNLAIPVNDVLWRIRGSIRPTESGLNKLHKVATANNVFEAIWPLSYTAEIVEVGEVTWQTTVDYQFTLPYQICPGGTIPLANNVCSIFTDVVVSVTSVSNGPTALDFQTDTSTISHSEVSLARNIDNLTASWSLPPGAHSKMIIVLFTQTTPITSKFSYTVEESATAVTSHTLKEINTVIHTAFAQARVLAVVPTSEGRASFNLSSLAPNQFTNAIIALFPVTLYTKNLIAIQNIAPYQSLSPYSLQLDSALFYTTPFTILPQCMQLTPLTRVVEDMCNDNTASTPSFMDPVLQAASRGSCQPTGGCACENTYFGPLCHTTKCSECSPTGTSLCVSSEDKLSVICHCLPGFTGTTCFQPLACEASAKKQCLHGGSLQLSSNGGKCASSCSCPTPWAGKSCNTCNLICKNSGASFPDKCDRCHCSAGFLGEQCQCAATNLSLSIVTIPQSSPFLLDISLPTTPTQDHPHYSDFIRLNATATYEISRFLGISSNNIALTSVIASVPTSTLNFLIIHDCSDTTLDTPDFSTLSLTFQADFTKFTFITDYVLPELNEFNHHYYYNDDGTTLGITTTNIAPVAEDPGFKDAVAQTALAAEQQSSAVSLSSFNFFVSIVLVALLF